MNLYGSNHCLGFDPKDENGNPTSNWSSMRMPEPSPWTSTKLESKKVPVSTVPHTPYELYKFFEDRRGIMGSQELSTVFLEMIEQEHPTDRDILARNTFDYFKKRNRLGPAALFERTYRDYCKHTNEKEEFKMKFNARIGAGVTMEGVDKSVVVGCVFDCITRDNRDGALMGQVYYYALTPGLSVNVGNTVVVNCATGFQVVKVVETEVENPIVNGVATYNITAMIVGKVDTDAYDAFVERQIKQKELRKELEARKKELERSEIYELLASKDPTMKSLLEEFKELGGSL